MMVRTQITLESELQKRARRRASDIGISLAEYVRRVVARDLNGVGTKTDISAVFDLGSSSGSDIAREKRSMIADSLVAERKHRRRKTAPAR